MGTWTFPVYILYWCINDNTRRPYQSCLVAPDMRRPAHVTPSCLQMHWHQAATMAATIVTCVHEYHANNTGRYDGDNSLLVSDRLIFSQIDGILPKGPYPPCLRMADRAILAGYPRVIVRRAGLLWSQQDFEWRWSVPLFKCLTVLEFSFILFDLCLLITFFNFIMNYVPIVTFWIFTYHKIWILSIMFCFIWSYWIIYFLACLEVSWRVVS